VESDSSFETRTDCTSDAMRHGYLTGPLGPFADDESSEPS